VRLITLSHTQKEPDQAGQTRQPRVMSINTNTSSYPDKLWLCGQQLKQTHGIYKDNSKTEEKEDLYVAQQGKWGESNIL
jgi:hypothetical protein